MEMIYHVAIDTEPERFCITNHRPEGAEAPDTMGYMRYIPGTGLEVTMRCYEQDPMAVYKEPDEPVYQDSCMEVFLDCFPELPQYGYINVEMNSAGAVLCGFGAKRGSRFRLKGKGIPHPEVKVTFGDGCWQVRCMLTEQLLETLYERPCRFAPGHKMRGNFYKCGEHTPSPHWASWSKVERLDFHTPEFFGTLVIGGETE